MEEYLCSVNSNLVAQLETLSMKIVPQKFATEFRIKAYLSGLDSSNYLSSYIYSVY